MQKPDYYISNFSGGKDSTAVTLRLIELGEPLDEVLCCDTTMEFPAMYRHIEKVKAVVEAAGVKFTILRAERDFEYYLCDYEVENRKPQSDLYGKTGYGWPGHKTRWCTASLKTSIVKKYLTERQKEHNVIQYIGIAADEDYRMERKGNQNPNHRHPLRDWGWTEADALAYCFAKGYDWEGLYKVFDRVSCWCCPLKSYDELRALRRHYPELWARMLDLDARQGKKFAHGYTVADFDCRFALEDALANAGESITNRAFFADLKRHLSGEVTAQDILSERHARRLEEIAKKQIKGQISIQL